ncbi:MAG: hypothetical protein KAG53_05235 [Endozoicomonadaceae bacterium]|nr:hypothetical protein [Endozoicomonadaceae bacterium]
MTFKGDCFRVGNVFVEALVGFRLFFLSALHGLVSVLMIEFVDDASASLIFFRMTSDSWQGEWFTMLKSTL